MTDAIRERLRTLLSVTEASDAEIGEALKQPTHDCLLQIDRLEFQIIGHDIESDNDSTLSYSKHSITIDELAKRTGMMIADFGNSLGAILYVGNESEAYIEIQDDGYYCVVSNEDIFHPNLTVVEDFLQERVFA